MSDIEPTIGWPAHCASIMTKLSEMEVRAITAEQEVARLQLEVTGLSLALEQDQTPPPATHVAGPDLTEFRKFVDLIEARAMACDGPVTPFLEQLNGASDAEKERFTKILAAIYRSPAPHTGATGMEGSEP